MQRPHFLGALSAFGAALGGSLVRERPAAALTPTPTGLRARLKPGQRIVAFAMTDMATVIDFAGPWEVFSDASLPHHPDDNAFALVMVGETMAPIEAAAGMWLAPRYTFADVPRPDVIVVGAQMGSPGLIPWLQREAPHVELVMSVCTGAFKVAQAGLFDGKRATTHHDFYDQHALAYFCLLLDGRYRETTDGAWLDYRTYTLVFHPPMTTHRDEMSDGTRFFMIELGAPWIETIRALGAVRHDVHMLHGEDPTWLALRLHREYLRGADATDFTIETLLYELCGWAAGESARFGAPAPPWLAAIDELLEREPERRLNVRALAAVAGVHPTHLARTFRRAHGRSMGDYVAGLRIQRVCRALAETTTPIAAIATDAGFADQPHLTRTFRELVGTTPAHYRRSALATPAEQG